MSIGYFLNPRLIKRKKRGIGGSKTLGNLFLWSDFLVDIDNKWKTNLKTAIEVLKEIGFKEISAYETPHGFQIWCTDFKKFIKENEPNTIKREQIYLKEMKKVADKLKKNKITFDYPISIDTRRIGRTPLHLRQLYGSENQKV